MAPAGMARCGADLQHSSPEAIQGLSALRRYWLSDTYEQRHAAGQEPQNVDKEFLRLWFRQNCDPYNDEVQLPTFCAVFHPCVHAC